MYTETKLYLQWLIADVIFVYFGVSAFAMLLKPSGLLLPPSHHFFCVSRKCLTAAKASGGAGITSCPWPAQSTVVPFELDLLISFKSRENVTRSKLAQIIELKDVLNFQASSWTEINHSHGRFASLKWMTNDVSSQHQNDRLQTSNQEFIDFLKDVSKGVTWKDPQLHVPSPMSHGGLPSSSCSCAGTPKELSLSMRSWNANAEVFSPVFFWILLGVSTLFSGNLLVSIL